ncbi:hypothetical protein GE09DRAFT_538947, partial [Coniochaeta sp. 2T2.1]
LDPPLIVGSRSGGEDGGGTHFTYLSLDHNLERNDLNFQSHRPGFQLSSPTTHVDDQTSSTQNRRRHSTITLQQYSAEVRSSTAEKASTRTGKTPSLSTSPRWSVCCLTMWRPSPPAGCSKSSPPWRTCRSCERKRTPATPRSTMAASCARLSFPSTSRRSTLRPSSPSCRTCSRPARSSSSLPACRSTVGIQTACRCSSRSSRESAASSRSCVAWKCSTSPSAA